MARLTFSAVASNNRVMRIFGEKIELRVEDAWNYGSKITMRGRPEISEAHSVERVMPLVRRPPEFSPKLATPMDFSRGISELDSAVRDRKVGRLSNRFSLHVDEVTQAIVRAAAEGKKISIESTCPKMEPMDWAHSSPG